MKIILKPLQLANEAYQELPKPKIQPPIIYQWLSQFGSNELSSFQPPPFVLKFIKCLKKHDHMMIL